MSRWEFCPSQAGLRRFARLITPSVVRFCCTGDSPQHWTFRLRHYARTNPRVLVLGIYLANRPNTCAHLVQRFSESRNFSVTQAWVALNGDPSDKGVPAVTVDQLNGFVPKFCIMNRILGAHDWKGFDYLIFVDDDIVVPAGFLDAFLGMQEEFDLAIAQPARTRNSYADRKFCRQQKGIRGRRTRLSDWAAFRAQGFCPGDPAFRRNQRHGLGL